MGCARIAGYILVLFGVVLIVVLGIIFPMVILPDLVQDGVDEKVMFKSTLMEDKTSEIYDKFIGGLDLPNTDDDNSEGDPVLYYISTVTNVKDFMDGDAKPDILEKGPFGYIRQTRKFNVVIADDTITYQSYEFEKKSSDKQMCKNFQEILGHPSPAECMDHDTEVIALNKQSAALMEQIGGGDGFVFSLAASVVYQTLQQVVGNLMPFAVSPVEIKYLNKVLETEESEGKTHRVKYLEDLTAALGKDGITITEANMNVLLSAILNPGSNQLYLMMGSVLPHCNCPSADAKAALENTASGIINLINPLLLSTPSAHGKILCALGSIVGTELAKLAQGDGLDAAEVAAYVGGFIATLNTVFGTSLVTMEDVGYYQYSTGKIAPFLLAGLAGDGIKGSFQPSFPIEWYHYFGEDLPMDMSKLLVVMSMHVKLNVMLYSMVLPGAMAINDALAMYMGMVAADPALQALPPISADAAAALTAFFTATDKPTRLSTYMEILKAKALNLVGVMYAFCTDPMDCDYLKGGLFVKKTADEYLFTGYTEPFTWMLLSLGILKASDGSNTVLVCAEDEYMRIDGTWSATETEELPFIRGIAASEDQVCPPTMKHSFCSKGHHKYMVDGKLVDATPELDSLFMVLPSYANSHKKGVLDIEFQKRRSCPQGDEKTYAHPSCTTTINTGENDIKSISQVLKVGGNDKTTRWPEDVSIGGSVGGQFAPMYFEGLTNPVCGASVQFWFGDTEAVLTYDLIDEETFTYNADEESSIDVCRYSLTPDSFKTSMDKLGKVNAQHFPPLGFLPYPPGKVAAPGDTYVALGEPNFYMDKLMNNGEQANKFTGIVTDADKDRSFMDVEPTTGAAIRAVVRVCKYFKFRKSILFSNILENVYYFPTVTIDSGGVLDEENQKTTGTYFNRMKTLPETLTIAGIASGVVLLFVGLFLLSKTKSGTKPQA
jgi:hypothetical protein